MGRSNSHEKIMELKKGPWTREEDQKLLAFIEQHGHGSWRALPAKAGLQRCGKSCRLRWTNYLRPDIKRGKFSTQEEKTIIRLHALLGNRWSAIATHLPKRTDNEIKNYWNTRLKKRLTRMGIDPATHKPKDNMAQSSAVVSHMAQWETARLEAEARLVREGKLLSRLQLLHKFDAPTPPAAAAPCLDVLKVWQASQNGFFSAAGGGCLESPTSVLGFSGNEQRGGTVECLDISSGVGRVNGCMQGKGKTDISGGVVYSLGCDINLPGSVGIDETMNNCDGFYDVNSTASDYYVGEFEDNSNYWSDLFNLVSSPVI